jgi:hypothetical protein
VAQALPLVRADGKERRDFIGIAISFWAALFFIGTNLLARAANQGVEQALFRAWLTMVGTGYERG